MDTIVAGMRYAGEVLTEPGLEDRTDKLLRDVLREDPADRALADPGLGVLAGQVAALTLHGDDPEQVLRAVIDVEEQAGAATGPEQGKAARETWQSLQAAESIPQVLAWRITTEQPVSAEGPLPWIAPVASRTELSEEQHEVVDWMVSQEAALRERVSELGTSLGDMPPAQREGWAQQLGERPDQAEPAEQWTRAAGVVAAYRRAAQATSRRDHRRPDDLRPTAPTSTRDHRTHP